jgi:hypothetical protein
MGSRTELGLHNERYYLNILTFTAFLIRLDLIINYFNCGYAQEVIPNDRKDEYPKTHPTGKTLKCSRSPVQPEMLRY